MTRDNYRIFALLSDYLNNIPDFITKAGIEDIVECGVSTEYAFAAILAAVGGLDIDDNVEDKELFDLYFNKMIHKLDANKYYNNAYYKDIKIPTVQMGNCELKYEKYQAYEAFVCNDITVTAEGRQIPQIGFFETEFTFPVVLENKRLWMSITPNEIETMKEPVDKAFGNVLTFGLGLGYYAYMIAEKADVESITVVEMNEAVIELFKEYILPQFKNPQKIKLVKADAFEYAEKYLPGGKYDFVFIDLWHDVSDGIEMYLKMKHYEKLSQGTVFRYWIEKSILCYL